MLTYERAKAEHFEELLCLIYDQKTTYLEPKLDLIQLTWEQFGKFFRTVGSVYRICQDHRLVGLCWVEEEGNLLFLQGLIIQRQFQRSGIGTQTLHFLENAYQDRVEAIELKVHESNPGAKVLYERCGYRTVHKAVNQGLYVMQKRLREKLPDEQAAFANEIV